jgi:hypothetical protein
MISLNQGMSRWVIAKLEVNFGFVHNDHHKFIAI